MNTSNTGASTLTITSGTIGRSVGGTLDFTPPVSGSISFTSTPTLTGGIIGGWATVTGTDWATVSGGNVVALPSYTSDTWAGGNNTTVTVNDTPASGSTTNSLRFASTTTGDLVTLSGTNVITTGGILVSSAFTAAGTIAGGTLEGSAGGDLVVNQNGVSNFTISSVIANNGGPTGLTKSGPGTLVLGTGVNTSDSFTGPIYINQGTIMLNGGTGFQNPPFADPLSGSNVVYFSSNAAGTTPTLNLNSLTVTVAGLVSGTSALTEGFSVGFIGATSPTGSVISSLTISGSGTYNYAGTLIDGSGSLSLTMNGTGTQILSGVDNYSGTTTIQSGTLQIGNGGTGGSLGTSTLITDDATLTIDLSSNLTIAGQITGTGTLYQIGSGRTALTGSNNNYSGGTYVSSGTLATAAGSVIGSGAADVTGGVLDVSSGAMSVGPLTVASGGTLNISLGNLLTSTGAASFAGTLNITGSPSANSYELIAYSGSPTGMFATATGFTGYALVYATGQLDLQSYSAFNNTSGNTTTISSGVDLNGGPLQINGGGSTVFNGPVQLDGAAVTISNGSSVTINGAPTLNSGSVAVNSGTFTINNNTSSPATGTGPVTITIATAATVQLAGSSSALTTGVNIVNNGSTASGGGLNVTGTNQVVGTVSGNHSTVADGNGTQATVYAGDTVVAPGASLTATQILQNSLTIGAGATVTIAPSGSSSMAALPSNSVATAGVSTDVATSDAASGTSDPFSAIQAAIASGSISSTTGQTLENRIAAIERLAATDPGLDANLLESRVLAALPSSSLSGISASIDATGGSNLLVVDASELGSTGSAFSASAAFSAGGIGGGTAAVPEPSSLILCALGMVGLAALALKRRRLCARSAGTPIG